jgi:hypothetical protein
MAVNLSPVGGVAAQFFDNAGNVLTGGKLQTYLAGTTTPQPVYTTAAGNIPWSNPIILDAAGRVSGSGEIWLTDGIQYKFILRDSNDVLIATYDNINGINSNFVNFTGEEETQTATQAQTVFTLTTLQYQPGVNNLLVFVNGSKQVVGTNYVETSSTVVTFVSGLNAGDVVDFCTATPINITVVDASQVSYNPPFTSAVVTNVEDKLAQTVSVKDFGAIGDGTTDDTTAFSNALLTLKDVYVPKGTYKITSSLALNSNQKLYGDSAAIIQGDYAGFLFNTVGTFSSAISSVVNPINTLDFTITMASATGLAVGDMILLADVVSGASDVNYIKAIVGNVVYTVWPTTASFPNTPNIRLYVVAPVKNAIFDNLQITNVNTSNGGGIAFTYTTDCQVTNCLLTDVDYISCTFQQSINPSFFNNNVKNSGKSGVGLRVTKSGKITENTFLDNLGDESISLYLSNSYALISNNKISQNISPFGGAGNNILVDSDNYYNAIVGNTMVGSATQSIYIFKNSSFNTIVGNTIDYSNFSSISIDDNSNYNVVEGNVCTNVVTAGNYGIQVASDCSYNLIGTSNVFEGMVTGNILDNQTTKSPSYSGLMGINTTSPVGLFDIRNGPLNLTTGDYASGTGTIGQLQMAAVSGVTYLRLSATAPSAAPAPVSINVTSTAPVLQVNNDLAFQAVSNTSLKVLLRGSDGVTRSATLTLS